MAGRRHDRAPPNLKPSHTKKGIGSSRCEGRRKEGGGSLTASGAGGRPRSRGWPAGKRCGVTLLRESRTSREGGVIFVKGRENWTDWHVTSPLPPLPVPTVAAAPRRSAPSRRTLRDIGVQPRAGFRERGGGRREGGGAVNGGRAGVDIRCGVSVGRAAQKLMTSGHHRNPQGTGDRAPTAESIARGPTRVGAGPGLKRRATEQEGGHG